MVSLRISRCSSTRNSPSGVVSLMHVVIQSALRSFGKPLRSLLYFSDIQRCILWAIYHTQFSQWIRATISRKIFLNSNISAMLQRHINCPTKLITFDWCSSIMTCTPVFTIWRRYCHILPFKAGTISTLQYLSTYCLLLTNSKLHADHNFYASSIVRTSHFSAMHPNRYIIWEKPLSAVIAEVSN